MITLKTAAEIEKMRDAGKIVAEVLALMEENVRPGISTAELDAIAERHIVKSGAIPTFKGYNGFPASICASLNDEIVHGIPRPDRILQEGDIISIDTGATFRGFVGDAARTFAIGEISTEAAKLIEVTKECFYAGMEKATTENRLGDVSHAIQRHAERYGYGVVRELVGHGVGEKMHEPPNVPNFGKSGRGLRLQKGLTIAIEPMIVTGHYAIRVLSDEWTCVTHDGGLAAHYENTIAVTDGEPLILTAL